MLRTLSPGSVPPNGSKFEEKAFRDSVPISDTLDNPAIGKLLETSPCENSIFKLMKYEENRLLSYKDRWPLSYIRPSELAEAGFFYLQLEDRVQCPFCHLIVFDWTYGDKPLREHMKKSPKCPFLLSCDVGNVALLNKPNALKRPMFENNLMQSVQPNVSYKPRHPQMADVKRRLLTFASWPLKTHTPEEMAECGFFYTGKNDDVSCYFCGGHLGNWEVDDDPWTEHEKFYSHCAFLSLSKNIRPLNKKIELKYKKPLANTLKNGFTKISGLSKPSNSSSSDIVAEAKSIFPETLVMEVVKSKNGQLSSLENLCHDILEWTNKKYNTKSEVSKKEVKKDGVISQSDGNVIST